MSDDWTEPIELATHATALIEAIRTGRAVPAGRLFGLPELPGDDYWLDMAGATAVTGIPPKTITSWLARGRRPATPSPATTTPLPAVLARNGDHVVADERESRSRSASIGQIRSVPSRAEPTGPIAVWRAVRPYATRPLAPSRTGWHVAARHCPAARRSQRLCAISRDRVSVRISSPPWDRYQTP